LSYYKAILKLKGEAFYLAVELLKQYRSVSDFMEAIFLDKQYSFIADGIARINLERELKKLKESLNNEQVDQVIHFHNELYPKQFYAMPDPPLILYYKGNISALNAQPAVSVIGSRKADEEGVIVAKEIGYFLAKNKICVVSGLAYGCDGAAHRGALLAVSKPAENFVPTVAVLANGLDTVYPSSHRTLSAEIVKKGGVLLSEYDFKETPRKPYFLRRNRLIAALASGVVIVQASERSGSLVTARAALEYNKEVMVVPGSVLSPLYQGSNELLAQGAVPVRNGKDVVNHLGLECVKEKRKQDLEENNLKLSPSAKIIFGYLKEKNGKAFIDQLTERFKEEEVLISLQELEEAGLVVIRLNNLVQVVSCEAKI
ncbi:MAG: DNA-protecting protein DprA, partial [Candidatus Dadabacteria bacterium]